MSIRSLSQLARSVLAAAAISAAPLATETAAAQERDSGADAIPTVVRPEEWDAYTSRFVDATGRVLDREKHSASHSEGQGYGLLLAVMANDRATFERIRTFTFDQLQIRSDHLFSWIFDPAQNPRVYDLNNASDGDVLIAFALIGGAIKWNEPRYLELAAPIVEDIGQQLVVREGGFTVLRPGAYGFAAGEHPDGPVVNLSYFVYGAFPLFAVVNDRYPWLDVWRSGLRLTRAATFGGAGVVPDWVTLRRDRFLAPARRMPQTSSYDAVRIPLYMALGGKVPAEFFVPFDRVWNAGGEPTPIVFDLANDRPVARMGDPGYQAIAALSACIARGMRVPARLRHYRNGTYFASTLHLLTLAALRWQHPECLDAVAAARLSTTPSSVE